MVGGIAWEGPGLMGGERGGTRSTALFYRWATLHDLGQFHLGEAPRHLDDVVWLRGFIVAVFIRRITTGLANVRADPLDTRAFQDALSGDRREDRIRDGMTVVVESRDLVDVQTRTPTKELRQQTSLDGHEGVLRLGNLLERWRLCLAGRRGLGGGYRGYIQAA